MSLIFSILHKCWRRVVPYYVRKRICFYRVFGGHHYEKEIQRRALEIGKKDKIKVLFIAVNPPMWRGQGVFDLMRLDSRFDPRIIISPFSRHNKEEASRQAEMMKKYFLSIKMETPPAVIDDGFDLDNWLDDFNPDIVFPCQHYGGLHDNRLDVEWNMHRLMAYIPYGIPTMKDQFVYNTFFHNLAWRVYHATPLHLKTARRLMANNAENVRIVGEIDYDKYRKYNTDPWKKNDDGKKRKRVIWAPHFTIDEDNMLHRASFLWLYEDMLRLAQKYKDSVQFVFKPHPHLFIVLVNRSDWGREKAEWYYNQWSSMPNTQLAEGDFLNFFKTSDAMIHDCGSFTGEYMMTGNPVMFMTRNRDYLIADADDFGAKCLDLHYFGQSVNDVETFINDTVLDSVDEKKSARDRFCREMFQTDGPLAAEKIYADILEGLGLDK